MEEVEETSVAPVATPTPTAAKPNAIEPEIEPVTPAVINGDDSEGGFTILQKGLFFAVIVGGVATYMKMNKRKNRRYLP